MGLSVVQAEDPQDHPDLESALESMNPSRELASKRSGGLVKRKTTLPEGRQTFQKIKKKDFLRYVKPPSSSRLYFSEGTDEAQLEKITKMEIDQLYKLLKKSKRPDIQLRLASLYVEMGRLIEGRIYEKHTQQMELFKAKKIKVRPKLNLAIVKSYSGKAINLFQSYLKKNSKRMDEVLFQLGYSYFQMGQPARGRQYYERLIRQFPKSSQLEDAYFHLGEYYFDSRDWSKARSHYAKASKFNSKFYSFSIYKIAWCFYNEGRVEKAIDRLIRVINDAKKARQSGRGQYVYFVREALNDLSSFYTYSKYSPKEAYSFFSSFIDSEKQKFKVMEKLAYAYKATGHSEGMRVIFGLLIRLDPYNPLAYDYKYQIVQMYSHLGNRKVFNQEFSEWLKNYSAKSDWGRKNKSDPKLLAKVSDLMEVTLRNYTFRQHHSFSKTKSVHSKNQSLFGYKMYAQYFPDSKFASDIWFHYGEILFDLDQFQSAAKKYETVVLKYPKSKNHETAALNRILALEKIIPTEKQVKEMAKKNPGQKVPFPPEVQELETAVRQYAKYYPKGKKIPNMMYLIANLHLEYRHYDTAIQYWMRIIQSNLPSKDPLMTQSVHLVLDTYNLKKDFVSLERVSRQFLQNPKIASLPIVSEIKQILRQIKFNAAQQMAKSGKIRKSAELYESFYRENKDSKLAVSALFNSAVNYRKINHTPKAIELYNILYKIPGKSKVIEAQVTKDLPNLYQVTGQYLKSAQFFEKNAKLYPKDKHRSDYLYNSAVIYDGFRMNEKAVSLYLQYYNTTKSIDRHEVYYAIGKIRQREGKIKKAIGNYIQYINSPGKKYLTKVQAAFRVAELNKILGLNKETEKWHKAVISIYRKFNQGVSYAARSQFELTYKIYKKFKSIRIPSQPSAQAQAMKNKLSLLESLKNKSKDVIRLDHGPEVIAVLTLMGLANQHLGDIIFHSPLPKGLTRADRKQYREGLKKTARPFYDVAEKHLSQAIDKAGRVEGYIPWLKSAQKAAQSFSKSDSLNFKQKVYPMTWEGVK